MKCYVPTCEQPATKHLVARIEGAEPDETDAKGHRLSPVARLGWSSGSKP